MSDEEAATGESTSGQPERRWMRLAIVAADRAFSPYPAPLSPADDLVKLRQNHSFKVIHG